MNSISTKSFKHTIRDIHKNADNRKFCFVIGAGASRKSGIPTGGELAEKWFVEIKERLDEPEMDEFISQQNIDTDFLAASYGSIYRKRFENDKTSGYEFLVQAMKTAKPSFGYIVLAQILSRSSGHCVVTTNFDSLVESSVYQFTNKTPLVCGHESLSGYARPSQTHPLIVKIHRDLLLSPKSDPAEISTLDAGWKEPLDHIFSTHIPIVIGYGGNDGSMMNYFENMNKPSNFFWCGLDDKNISERIKSLITKQEGNFVTIDGFDDLMYSLLWAFDEIKPIKDELKDITNERIFTATKQLDEITAPKVIVENVIKNVETNAKINEDLSALEYSDMADKEPDLEKRKQIYLQAVQKYPKTDWLIWQLTYFLHFVKKDYDELDMYYLDALKLNKESAGFLCNYAIYLEFIKKDFKKAEEFYLQAISKEPNNALALGNYANFLKVVKKDKSGAESYYQKAIEADPKDVTNISNYANFLKENQDYTAAENQYLRAMEVDPNDAKNLSNYAFFLESVKKEYDKAEEIYIKAIALDPLAGSINSDYANFLNYVRRNTDKAEEYYKKSILQESDNPVLNGIYAGFLYHRKKEYGLSEELYKKALGEDENNIFNSINYAVFLSAIKKDFDGARSYYEKAMNAEPENISFNRFYAQYLLEQGDKTNASKHLDLAFQLKEENEMLLELWFLRYINYPEFLKQGAEEIERLLQIGFRSDDWDFSYNVDLALKEGHPEPKKLLEFEERITGKSRYK